MRISVFVSFACAVTTCTASLYYQPNGVFIPITVSILAEALNQQSHTENMPAQQPTAISSLAPTTTPSTSPLNPSSHLVVDQLLSMWHYLFGNSSSLASWLGLSRGKSEDPDDPVALLAELLTSLKPVVLNFLDGLTKAFADTKASDIENVLREPLNDLENYLISMWPDSNNGHEDKTMAFDIKVDTVTRQQQTNYSSVPSILKQTTKMMTRE
ncbi:hypothetical protein GGI25_002762 [Coemansia spiralis]|uniref:Uncharacterized protein n=2 Tax=Coemansia TaxID=4863 RepID=A0A9W8GA03_9FUNG|nr:hypothetical protein BX070DRAFT_234571 [Coemansia spiralis]KAJ1993493.1 hypothetical protein EDC05_002119 [Coemansia umbellata]KAJ2625265.1 hypothetical protein GGI26_000735 [Coemansia sp. RSA 1358]KAJ2677972.1 hypothetical protein GGI25_002762 [Coemansia spiralis]